MSEIWKDVIGYEGVYKVSDRGRIKSLDRVDSSGRNRIGRVRSQRKDKDGYFGLTLYMDGKAKSFLVHRLVAFAFIENEHPDKFNIVDHKNGVRDDNSIENLRWVDDRENVTDGYRRRLGSLTSRYEGVCWDKSKNKWKSSIKFGEKTVFSRFVHRRK